jgi:hypothetical protein
VQPEILRRSGDEPFGDSFKLLKIEDLDIYLDFYLLINKRAFINRAARTFIEYAQDRLKGSRAE